MSVAIDFIFDFASPNAYMVHKVIPDFVARTGAEVRYVPCLLGGIMKATNNKPPFIQYADIPAKSAYEMLEFNRFIADHGLDQFRMNPHFPINSLALMRAATVADADGALLRFVDVFNKAMWEDGRNVGDPEVIAAVLTENDFDATDVLKRAQDPEMKERLVARTNDAVAKGAFGVPTFFVGAEMFFGKERLGQLEAYWRKLQ